MNEWFVSPSDWSSSEDTLSHSGTQSPCLPQRGSKCVLDEQVKAEFMVNSLTSDRLEPPEEAAPQNGSPSSLMPEAVKKGKQDTEGTAFQGCRSGEIKEGFLEEGARIGP